MRTQYNCLNPRCLHFIHDIIFNHPLITDLNKSLKEKLTGNRDGDMLFVSAYNTPKPEDDFVDLDALHQNIIRTLDDEK